MHSAQPRTEAIARQMLGRPSGRVYASGAPDRASTAILGPQNSAHNSGHSACPPPAEMHKCTALGLIYLQSRRSTTELRPQALLYIDNRRHAHLSRDRKGQTVAQRTKS